MKEEYGRLVADLRRYLEQEKESTPILLTAHPFSPVKMNPPPDKFEEAKPTSKERLCIHRCDADEFKVQDAGAAESQFLKDVQYISPSLSPKGLKGVIGQIAPGLRVVEKIPSDEKAKKIAETWKEQEQVAEITFLLLQEGVKERAFLQELVKAVNLVIKPAKLLDGRRLEEEKKWDLFLKTSELKWIFASSGLPQWPELLRYYREIPAAGSHFLGEKPLHFLAPISTYFKTPLLKRSLWQKLSSLS
jgi:hypothetical protein